MSTAKTKAAGPSWTEVILGAVLSVLLGAVLGAALLALHPVAVVTDIPKDAPADAIFLVQGRRDSGRAGEIEAARRSLASGAAVTVDEGLLNALAATVVPAAPAPGKAPAGVAGLTGDTPNVRIRDGVLQLSEQYKLSLFGAVLPVVVQARGTFAKSGSSVRFVPSAVSVGSLPVQRLPGLSGLVVRRLLLPASIPDDVAGAWAHVSDAALEGTALRLTP